MQKFHGSSTTSSTIKAWQHARFSKKNAAQETGPGNLGLTPAEVLPVLVEGSASCKTHAYSSILLSYLFIHHEYKKVLQHASFWHTKQNAIQETGSAKSDLAGANELPVEVSASCKNQMLTVPCCFSSSSTTKISKLCNTLVLSIQSKMWYKKLDQPTWSFQQQTDCS